MPTFRSNRCRALGKTALLLLGLSWPASAHNGAVAIAVPVDGISLDGDFSDWPETAPRFSISLPEHGVAPNSHEDFSGDFRAAYSAEKRELYLAIEVEDESIVIDRSADRDWDTEDGCEVYLGLHQGGETTARQYILRGEGDPGQDSPAADVRASVRVGRGDRYHRYEWRLPLGDVELGEVENGLTLSVDVVVCDRDEDGSFSWMAWGQNTFKLGEANRRGDLVLVKDPSAVGALGGRVYLQDSGEPIPGAHVRLQAVDEAGLRSRLESGPDGSFRVQMPAGQYRVQVEADRDEITRTVRIEPGMTSEIQLAVKPSQGDRVPAGPGTALRAGSGFRTNAWFFYGTMDGLLGGHIAVVRQDRDGYLWIGSAGGLSRFDGQEFVHYTARDGLVENEGVTALVIDRQGVRWIGTNSGLSRFDGEAFTNYTTRDGLPDNAIQALCEDAEGHIWIGTERGLSRFDGERLTNLARDDGLSSSSVQALVEDPEGGMWVATQGRGLLHFDGKAFTQRTTADGLVGNDTRSLLVDRNGDLWIGASNGLGRFDGESFTNYTTEDGLPYSAVYALLEDRSGQLWIATCEDLISSPAAVAASPVRYDGERFAALDDVRNDFVFSFLEDREGNVWAGTIDRLARYDTGDILHYTTDEGLAGDVVHALLQDEQGRLWVGTNGGLSRIDVKGRAEQKQQSYPDSLRNFTRVDGLPHDVIDGLLQDRRGDIWIATYAGLSRYDGERFHSLEADLPHNRIRHISEDLRGHLWMASDGGGAIRYDGRRFSSLTAADGLPNNFVGNVIPDESGDLWISTWESGVTRLSGESIVQLTTADGLMHNDVISMLVDGRGRMWMGTQGGGVSRYDGGVFTNFTSENGLTGDNVEAIIEDSRGVLWFATSSGISRYDGTAFQTLLRRDGLATNRVATMLEDLHGHIWIGLLGGGLIRYRPTVSPPPVFIADVVTDRHHGPAEAVRLPTTQQILAIEFRGISFKTRPEAMLYRYRMAGYDDEWRITRQGRVEYVDLPRGEYTFSVQAIDRDLSYSPAPASVAVEVHWPYGQVALWVSVGLSVMVLVWQGRQLVERNRTLRREEERFRNLLESAPDGMVIVDGEGRIVMVNEMTEKLFGYGREELVGEPVEVLVPERHRGGHRAQISAFVSAKRARPMGTGREFHGRRKEGGQFPAEINLSPQESAEGPMVVAAVRDVTERAKLQRSLLEAKEAAEEANQTKSEFLANMSHEIRTPMNAILGFAEILRGMNSDPGQGQYLNSIQSSGKSLLGLINDILDMSKVEAGKLELEYATVDAPAIFNDMQAVFAQKVDEKGLEFRIDVDDQLPRALVLDETRVRQILINLLGNAAKFTDEGYVRLHAQPDRTDRDAKSIDLHLAVEDTGIGIPEDQQDKVFGAFEQTSGQSYTKFGGTGLGLAITRKLVELMGGRIWVESVEGEGSTFHVLLPSVTVAEAEELAESADSAEAEGIAFESATVLVVDDIDANRQLVGAMLAPAGLTVMEAVNGREAVEYARRHVPELILMDLRMPEMDGFEATRILRDDPRTQAIPIVVLTASVTREDEESTKELTDGFLKKPVSKGQLVQELCRFLPYRREEVVEPEAAESDDEWSPDQLSPQIRARLPELADRVESELASQWEGLRDAQMITETEEFAARVQTLGQEYEYPPLTRWGERLEEQANLFQLDALPTTLGQLPQLLQDMRSHA